MSNLTIYSPEGLADAMAGHTPIHPLSPLTGRRIVVLDNGKSGAETLLRRMGERLAARTRGEFLGVRRKGSAATPCEPELLESLVAEADLVLTGTAD
jgi:hypothetical protein